MTSKARTRRKDKRRETLEATNKELIATPELVPKIEEIDELIDNNKQKSSRSPWMTFILDSEEDPTTRVRVFPRFAIFSLMALAVYSRHLLLTGFEGLGMLHPDENFQAIEVAHLEVYGYGFIPHEEYVISSVTNKTTGRPPPSWIYPRMYVLLFQAREFFGWSPAPFVLARRFHGMVAAALPFVVYKFTRIMFGNSRDIAFIAATLVAFSKHLMLLGIHPFLQSFISPVIFAVLAIVMKILGVEKSQDSATDRQYCDNAKLPDMNLVSKLGLLLCGIVLGVLFFVNLESVLMASVLLITCMIPSHTSRMDTLPSKRALAGTVALISGIFTGIALGAAQDYAVSGLWCWTPSRAIQFLIGSFRGESNYTMYLKSFLSGSHVHMAVILAAAVVSAIYVIWNWRISRIFDGMVSTSDKVLLQSTFRITVFASVFLGFYSCQSHQDIRVMHDVIILILIAGSAAVYLLYSSLYTYVMSVASPGKTTRNMVKLILYAELFLYMFEARMTFPTAHNKNIAEWAHERQWESAFVNRCLHYVGQQTDVTAVAIDYPIEMTGGFNLLHHHVPIYARGRHEFREWRIHEKRTKNNNKDEHVMMSTMDDATDFISLLNPGLFIKRVIEKAEYNYVIISGGRKFFKRGFREVFNASDARVFKRSKSRTESEYLLTVADKIPIGTNATILEYEGKSLILLKNYAEAVVRFKAALEIDANDTRIETWKLLIFSLNKLNRSADADEARNACKSIYGSECEQHFKLDMDELRQDKLDADLRTANETYKFPT